MTSGTAKGTGAQSGQQSQQLSGSDIAGIVVEVVGALILAGLLLFFLRRRGKRRKSSDLPAQEDHGTVLERHEKDGAVISELHEHALRSEAGDSARHELETPRPELEGDGPVQDRPKPEG